MFRLFNKKNETDKDISILSPIEGEAVSIKDVNDPTFSEEVLGKGVAIKPECGRVVAPIDGEIAVMFKTKHAISIISKSGDEVLIHIGLDTANLNGEFFKSYVNAKDQVKAGDLLLEFDIEKIKEAGYDTISMVVITNTDNYSDIQVFTGKHVKELDEIIKLIRK